MYKIKLLEMCCHLKGWDISLCLSDSNWQACVSHIDNNSREKALNLFIINAYIY